MSEETQSIEGWARQSSILPQVVSETGVDHEEVEEAMVCDSISGGADYANDMPRRLSLTRRLKDGTEHRANYVQAQEQGPRPVRSHQELPEQLFKTPYVTYLPPPIALALWPMIRGCLERAVHEGPGEFTLDQLYNMVGSGSMHVSGIFLGLEMQAAAVTQRVQYPNKRTLRVVLLGGRRMDSWLSAFGDHAMDLAEGYQADDIELHGRRGWLKALEPMGYTNVSVTIHKRMRDSEETDHEHGRAGSG